MNKSKCPACGGKLGNFLYAKACPHCHAELLENTRALTEIPKPASPKVASWLARAYSRVVRFVES
jgi:hypothetical protein